MAYYVVKCSQSDSDSLTVRPSAAEIILAINVAIEQGWTVEEIRRDKMAIDEVVLRRDAERETSFASQTV